MDAPPECTRGKVADFRRQAFDAYERVGLPSRRIEDWKYTDLRVLMREVLPLATAPDAAALTRAGAALKLHAPQVVYDLPSGGRRLIQKAQGYVATLVAGQVTYRDGEPTDALPGRLLRGAQAAPVSMAAE